MIRVTIEVTNPNGDQDNVLAVSSIITYGIKPRLENSGSVVKSIVVEEEPDD